MIRPFAKEDLPEMIAIARKAWKDIFAGFRTQLGDELYDVLFENKYQDKAYQLTNFTEKYPEQCLICVRNGKVAGFVTFFLEHDRKIGHLTNNAADPDSGEKGVGQEMYQAVFELFRREGMLAASVSTGLDEGHARARAAYERAGFQAHLDSVNYFMKL